MTATSFVGASAVVGTKSRASAEGRVVSLCGIVPRLEVRTIVAVNLSLTPPGPSAVDALSRTVCARANKVCVSGTGVVMVVVGKPQAEHSPGGRWIQRKSVTKESSRSQQWPEMPVF